jgi:hypothetical protein
MKILPFILAITLQVSLPSVTSAQSPNPSLTYSQSEKLIFLDNEVGKKNSITFKANFKPDGCKYASTLWEFNGVNKKNWEVVGGSIESNEVELEFKKVGNYSFNLTTTYTYGEDDEDEISIEQENVITVANNLDELTQLHADSNYLKLVKKASTYLVRPEYLEDPTPNIFLAKGYYGIYKKELDDPIIDDPLSASIECIAAAMELDFNGIYNVSIHKIWLNHFQKEWLETEVLDNLDNEEGYYVPYTGTDNEIKIERSELSIEGCEIYASISKNPISIKFMEAALRYNAKDAKTANQIWSSEIPKLENLSTEDLENMTESDLTALKYGVMLSAVQLTKTSSTNSKACRMLNQLKKAFEYDRGFNAFLKSKYNNCIEE